MNWGIAIEVDGEQHFQGQCYGMQARQQQEWDRKVDAMCEQSGQRLVRLHYKDDDQWVSTVKAAIEATQAGHDSALLLKTTSYSARRVR
eukprot:6918221-Prymnesium_polylepis.1